MKVLVTGGCGFIGSVLTDKLRALGNDVTILDRKKGADWRVDLGKGKLKKETRWDTIYHLAGELRIAATEKDLDLLVKDNVKATAEVLRRCKGPIVFASTDSVYGVVEGPCGEDQSTTPTTNYGMSKLWCEKLIRTDGRPYTILRLFNTVGGYRDVVENLDSEEHIFPRLLRAVRENKPFKIFGSDYPTKDGTPSRDYIHVSDVADLMIKAADFTRTGTPGVFNVGSGRETTVKELLDEFKRHWSFELEMAGRRDGDVPCFLCDNVRAKTTFGWEPSIGLSQIVASFCESVKER